MNKHYQSLNNGEPEGSCLRWSKKPHGSNYRSSILAKELNNC